MVSTASTAPRITPEIIEEHIVSEHYFTAYQGARAAFLDDCVENGNNPVGVVNIPDSLRLLTICVLVMKNGFTVLGKSACASPSNFSQEIGEKVAREDAVNQIWPLLGYELRSRLHSADAYADSDLGEALTMMMAHRLGNQNAFKPEHAEAILSMFRQDEGEEGGQTFRDKLVEGPVPASGK